MRGSMQVMSARARDALAADARDNARRASPRPGIVAAGATSASGRSTNARSCMRGCGNVSRARVDATAAE